MNQRRSNRLRGFTILEVMIAIFIFSLVLTAIYSIWWAIMKGSILGMEAAAGAQRARVAVRAIEDAFLTSSMFTANIKHYAFLANTSGEMAEVSMVSRLPSTFPGVGRYDQVVRRVSFTVERGPNGNELMLSQAPMLQDIEQIPPYTLKLARNVSLFQLSFYDLRLEEWVDEWMDTNQMPRMVKVTLGMGQIPNSREPRDLVTRLISIPSAAVMGDIQGAGPPMPVQQNLIPQP